MPEDVDRLTPPTERGPLAPLPDPWRGLGRRRRWESVDGERQSERTPGIRCGYGRYDRKTGESLDGCGARASWRVDMICDLCGPRVGHCCDLHNAQVPYAIKEGWLRCHAAGPGNRTCGGNLVEIVRAEHIGW